jgi:hypothetical protein
LVLVLVLEPADGVYAEVMKEVEEYIGEIEVCG